MKLLSFEIAGQHRFGALVDDGILDLTRKLAPDIATLRSAISANALDRIPALLDGAYPDLPLAGTKLLTPIPYPEKIICVGVNYANRNEEYKDGTSAPKYPIHYISTWTTLRPGDVIATGTPIGAGVRFDPPRFLQAGDVVEVEVDGIGTLANTVSDEQP